MIILPCDINDAQFIYDCRYDPVSNANSTIQTIPIFDEHKNWFEKKLNDPSFRYYKGRVVNSDVAFVRFVDNDEGIEVSICTHPKFRRLGFAKEALYKAIKIRGEFDKMYSTIKIQNLASYKTFAFVSKRLYEEPK